MKKNNVLFRIDLPDGWENQTTYLFLGPEDGDRQHVLNLQIDTKSSGEELYDYARERIDMAVEAMPNSEIIKEEEKTLENGNETYQCIFKWISPDGKIVFQKLIYMILDDVAYSFSAAFSKRTLKTIRHEVDKIIESFEPLPNNDEE